MTNLPILRQTSRAKRIALVLIDGFPLLSASAAVEPFLVANRLSGNLLYSLRYLSLGPPHSSSAAGAGFDTKPFIEASLDLDLVLLVSGGNPITFLHPELNGWLRRLDARGVALGGVAGGAAILAGAGLMNNRRFTVHGEILDALRANMADLLLEQRHFVIDRNRYSCGGGIAALDMGHAMIAADHGVEFARQVSDLLVHTHIHAPDAPQKGGYAAKHNIQHPHLVAAIGHMESHLADPLALDQLAQLAGIGARQLQRLSQNVLGMPAMRFYRHLRLDKARLLLEQTSLPIQEIAAITGFVTHAHFTRSFHEEYQRNPRDLRDRVGR